MFYVSQIVYMCVASLKKKERKKSSLDMPTNGTQPVCGLLYGHYKI